VEVVMTVFHYKMQGILDIKEKLEERAKQDFAQANMRLNNELAKMEQLRSRKFYYMQEGVRLRSSDLDVRQIRENKMAVAKMDDYIADEAKAIARANKEVEKARIALQEVMKDRKAHEKLKEHAFEDFVKEELAAENKEIDQLTSYKYGQRMMEEH
jgi:flagellar FliJ protein